LTIPLPGPNQAVFFKRAEAILVADDGPSEQLDAVLDYLDEHTIERLRASHQELAGLNPGSPYGRS
jgi:hypothetical protein